MIHDSLLPDYDGQVDSPETGFRGANGSPTPRYGHLARADDPRTASSGYRRAPDDDEAPSLDRSLGRGNGTLQSYAHQPHADLPRRRFLDEADDTDFDDPAYPESRRRPILAAIMFSVLMAAIGSTGGALWFYYGPNLSSTHPAPVDKTAEALTSLADEQRKLTQAISALQLIQDALQKNAAAREQDVQRLSAETRALKAELDGLRSAVANAAAHPPIAPTPKSPAVQAKKKGAERKSVPPQAENPPIAASPEHQ